jgi:putative NADPH-quinone reductase
LVVQSHPNPESYNAVIAQTFIDAATDAGHEVRRISLYEYHPTTDPLTTTTNCYRPNMSRWERENYFTLLQQHHNSSGNNVQSNEDTTRTTPDKTLSKTFAPEVQQHIELLQWCDTLVFIYPTWWMNTPASIKGFHDRTLLPGPTWEFPSKTHTTGALLGLVPKLNHIQRIIGISTYGANNTTVFLAGDNGRRMISNAIRHTVCPQATVTWLGLYGIDNATLQQRQDFLKNVAHLPTRI